jgi:N-acyl amino acid synthase of PEP-CTERM/exosortase system
MTPKNFVSATTECIDESLLDRFNAYFRVVTGVAGGELQEALRIRYQVYCVENPFENPVDHLDGFERDEFDTHSIHSLLIHRATGHAVGTTRLIMPVQYELENSFPVQRICRLPQLKLLPLDRMAEVSRFSISKQFRRRQCDTLYEGQDSLRERRAMAPLMSLGLIQSLVRTSAEHGITHWCASMEPTLLRLLATMSIKFETLGPLVQYHGTRQPCYCEVGPMLQRVKSERRPIWEVLTDCGTLPYRRRSLAA